MTGRAYYKKEAPDMASAQLRSFMARRGQYPRLANGKILPKVIGLLLEESGREIIWQDKPGWADGFLISENIYDRWLNSVKF